jgi:hypothetical protein
MGGICRNLQYAFSFRAFSHGFPGRQAAGLLNGDIIMDIIIVSIIIGIALVYLILAFIRRIKKPSCSCGCENCSADKDKQNGCSGKIC